MAVNLVKAGYPVTGFDVVPAALEAARGARHHRRKRPPDAVAGLPSC